MSAFLLYSPPRAECPNAIDEARLRASVATGSFNARHLYPRGAPPERAHVITTAECSPCLHTQWGPVAMHRVQSCSCGTSWLCDAPDLRAMFLITKLGYPAARPRTMAQDAAAEVKR